MSFERELDRIYKPLIRKSAKFGMRYFREWLDPLKQEIEQSSIKIVFETYVGKMFFFSGLSLIAIFLWMMFLFLVLTKIPVLFALVGSLLLSLVAAFAILTIFHSYPFQLVNSKKRSIEGNLPFAMNHMAAISASGVPPFIMFKLLTGVEEYGEISSEAKLVVRNVESFGMDITTAMRQVADRTPSDDFRQFLYGIISTTETGGSLEQYLKNAAKDALFNYRIKREKYLTTLSTYADFYTAVLIAAPLFFISILSVMSMIGGQIMGLSITDAMQLGIYGLIPVLNVIFIMFIHFTQPVV